VVIRAFNEEAHLGQLLEGITRQTLKEVETILVDSGSTDNTLAIAAQYPVKVVHIGKEEFSFGRSLNRGIQAARGEFVAIISAHCYPLNPDWLENLLAPFADPQVALSYGMQRGGETNRYSEHCWFRQYFPETSVPDQATPYCHNANAAIRRELWQTHPFDEHLTGLEDLAWGSWAKAEGYKIAYVAEAPIIHLHAEGPRQVYNRYRREAVAMKQILPKSRFTPRNFAGLLARMVLSDLGYAVQDKVLLRQAFNILWFRLCQYWGTYRGYRYSGAIDQQLQQQFYYPPGILSDKSPAGYSKIEGKSRSKGS
jgi:glycosyltransferase involved in cell wall biosynthesis